MVTNNTKLLELIKILSNEREKLNRDYGVKTLGVFGSYVRNEQNKESDIDILVEFDRKIDFFKFLELEDVLKELLKNKVDLVVKDSLKPRIKENILNEVMYI